MLCSDRNFIRLEPLAIVLATSKARISIVLLSLAAIQGIMLKIAVFEVNALVRAVLELSADLPDFSLQVSLKKCVHF